LIRRKTRRAGLVSGSLRSSPLRPVPAAEAAREPSEEAKTAAPPDPEVSSERPRRRRFTAEYKKRILEEADAAERGQIGALLRREGLYSSLLSEWRRQCEEATTAGLTPKKRGRKVIDALAVRNAELERDLQRVQERLRKAEIIIDVQKKLSILLGRPLPETSEDDE
jgi:transposase-like protein